MRRLLLLLSLSYLMLLAACGSATSHTPSVASSNHGINAALLQGSGTSDWPVFGYDPGHTGYVDALASPHTLQGKLLWLQRVGPIFSSPVAGLGMLFIASTNGYLYALKQDSGTVIWRAHLNNKLTDATPALEGQVLFVSTHSTALEALNAHTGVTYWAFDTGEKIQAPPLIVGSDLLLATPTTLWTLNATSGRLLWKFHRGGIGWPTTGSPTLSGNTVYIGLGSGTQLWALNLNDGHILWSFDTADRITSAALVQADTVYIATWRGHIFALNRADGAIRWMYSLNLKSNKNVVDGVGGSMALADGRLYVGDYRGLMLCIDALHGTLIWSYATAAQILGTPVIASDRVYIGSDDGNFYALDRRTGRPAWHYSTGEIRSSASLANGHLFVGSLNGVVYAFA